MHHTDINSSASLSLANLVAESNVIASHVNVDDEMWCRLSEAEGAEDDSQSPLSATAGEEGNDNPHPTLDSTEPHGDTQLAIPSQINMETGKSSDCDLTAASLESNPDAFLEARADGDVIKPAENQNEDPVLNDTSSELEIERTPSPDAIHEASPGSDTIQLTETCAQDEDPVSSEAMEKSSEHEANKRSPSPASQQHRPDTPTDDLREIESFLSNISNLSLSSDSAASIDPLD